MDADDVILVDIDGTVILAEVTSLGGEEQIDGSMPSFSGVGEAISKIAHEITTAIKAVAPESATMEFGCELGVESGKLTALLVKGSGTASIKVSMTWGGNNG